MKRVILRVATVATALAVAIGLAEGFVRVVMPQEMGALAPWYKSHPVYRFRHYPNMDAERSWGNPYRLRTNSHGVRADREEAYRSPGETRIVVHGDSQTLGVGVENQDTFVQRTERLVRRTFGAVDVLNMGVSAYGPDQEYLLFLEEGRKYSPRICVIAVCLNNDLDDVEGSNTAFRLEGDRLAFIRTSRPLRRSCRRRRRTDGWRTGRTCSCWRALICSMREPTHAMSPLMKKDLRRWRWRWRSIAISWPP